MSNSFKERFEERIQQVKPDRTIGLFGAVTIGVGALMGAGVYVLIGIASNVAGPSLWISYIICGLLAYLTTLMFADMSARFRNGGAFSFAYSQLGSLGGFTTGWFLALGSIFACGLYALGFAEYLNSILGLDIPDWSVKLMAGIGVLGLTALFSFGSGDASKAQKFLTWGNLIILLIFILFSLFHIKPSNMDPMFPKGVSGTMGAIGIIYISFFGYQLIANNADEIKDPENTIPKAMKISMLIAFCFYLAVAIVCVLVVPWNELAASNAPLVLVAEVSFGVVGFYLISIGGILASASALGSTLLSQSRQIFAMGKRRFLPDPLGEMNKRFKSPQNAVLSGGVLVVIALIFLDIEFIAKSANFCLLASFIPISLAVAKYYRTHPEQQPKSTFRKYLPELTLVVNVFLLLNLGLVSLAFGQQLALIGAAVYFFYSKKRETRSRSGLNVQLGDDKRGLIDLKTSILVPMANPQTQVAIMEIAKALLQDRGGEIVALSVVKTPESMDYHEALIDANQSLDIVERSARLNKEKNVKVRPVIRASRDLAEGIVYGAEDNSCQLVVMGLGTNEKLLEGLVRLAQTDFILLHQINDEEEFKPKKIGILLQNQANLELMMAVENDLAKRFDSEVDFISILHENPTPNESRRHRDLIVEGIKRHQPEALYSAKTYRAANTEEKLIEISADYDVLILGAKPVKILTKNKLDKDYLNLIFKLRCNSIIVRKMPTLKKLIHKI